jgi:hypothetical protein
MPYRALSTGDRGVRRTVAGSASTGPHFRKTIGFDGSYRRPHHGARLILTPRPAAVHRRSVVPHQHVACSPMVLVGEFGSGCHGDQFVEQCPCFDIAQTLYGVGV